MAKNGHKIILIDSSTSKDLLFGESLPPIARKILRNLGLFEQFLKDYHLPCYGNLSAWGSSDLVSTNYTFDPNGHGWHIDRFRFNEQLRNAASKAGAIVAKGTKVIKTEIVENGCILIIRSNNKHFKIYSDWVIDASGRYSSIAQKHGAFRIRDDTMIAFFTYFHKSSGNDNDTRTVIEAAPNGWWYTVLLPSGERMVYYLTDSDLIDRSTILSTKGFLKLMEHTNHIKKIIKDNYYDIIKQIYSTDARSAHLDRFIGFRWLSVGDASISFDPLSSQGIFNAMYTGMKAGYALSYYLLGNDKYLKDYEHILYKIYYAYKKNLTNYYTIEKRWQNYPFWNRRQKKIDQKL